MIINKESIRPTKANVPYAACQKLIRKTYMILRLLCLLPFTPLLHTRPSPQLDLHRLFGCSRRADRNLDG
jgi:hypothetical protein